MKRLAGVMIPLVAMVAGGCSGAGIVNKDESKDIKKVAIVSLYSNRTIYHNKAQGESAGMFGALAAITEISKNGLKGYEGLTLKDDRLIGGFMDVWSQELSKVNGWTIVPYSEFRDTQPFKDFIAKAPGTVGYRPINENVEKDFISPTGMKPYVYAYSDDTAARDLLKNLARSLKVDAVAVIGLDMFYKVSTGVGIIGTAVAASIADVRVVTKNGGYAVATPEHKQGEGIWETSDKSIPMAGGLAYSPELEQMLKEAQAKLAAYYRTEISKDL